MLIGTKKQIHITIPEGTSPACTITASYNGDKTNPGIYVSLNGEAVLIAEYHCFEGKNWVGVWNVGEGFKYKKALTKSENKMFSFIQDSEEQMQVWTPEGILKAGVYDDPLSAPQIKLTMGHIPIATLYYDLLGDRYVALIVNEDDIKKPDYKHIVYIEHELEPLGINVTLPF